MILKFLKQINYQLPWIILLALITIQSGFSGSAFRAPIVDGVDKIIHFVTFGVLGWLLSRGFSNAPGKLIPKHYIWFVIFIAVIFAVLDELHQSQTAGRYSGFWDWIADTLGIIIFTWWYKKRYIMQAA